MTCLLRDSSTKSQVFQLRDLPRKVLNRFVMKHDQSSPPPQRQYDQKKLGISHQSCEPSALRPLSQLGAERAKPLGSQTDRPGPRQKSVPQISDRHAIPNHVRSVALAVFVLVLLFSICLSYFGSALAAQLKLSEGSRNRAHQPKCNRTLSLSAVASCEC